MFWVGYDASYINIIYVPLAASASVEVNKNQGITDNVANLSGYLLLG